MCAGYAAVWVPRLTPSENICTAPPDRGTPGGHWQVGSGAWLGAELGSLSFHVTQEGGQCGELG